MRVYSSWTVILMYRRACLHPGTYIYAYYLCSINHRLETDLRLLYPRHLMNV